MEKHEGALLSNLKKWACNYFASNNVITNDLFVPLNKVHSEKGDFDVLAKIVHIHDLDEYTNELKLRDQSGSSWFTLALKLKFPNIRTGDVVRVRSATVDETATTKKVLNMSHYSNIMTFIHGAKVTKDIKAKVNDDHEKPSKGKTQAAAVVLTEVDKKYQNMKVTPLHELFHEADSDPELAKETTFRTTFNV
jgi:hypothetical protein